MKEEARKIFGTLTTMSVELPYENEDKRKEAEKMNKEIAHLGFRTYRAATDWGYEAFADTYYSQKKRNPMQKHLPEGKVKLISGDLVKIFKTVSEGDVAWQGTINFDRRKYHHGYQKGMSQQDWSIMFFSALPAKLERDGKTIYGALEPFCETGTEGVVWSVAEYGKAGYDGLNCLQDGDKLTVYSEVRNGEVEWEGKLDFDKEQIEKIGWTEILRKSKNMDTQKWMQMCWDRRPIMITPKP